VELGSPVPVALSKGEHMGYMTLVAMMQSRLFFLALVLGLLFPAASYAGTATQLAFTRTTPTLSPRVRGRARFGVRIIDSRYTSKETLLIPGVGPIAEGDNPIAHPLKVARAAYADARRTEWERPAEDRKGAIPWTVGDEFADVAVLDNVPHSIIQDHEPGYPPISVVEIAEWGASAMWGNIFFADGRDRLVGEEPFPPLRVTDATYYLPEQEVVTVSSGVMEGPGSAWERRFFGVRVGVRREFALPESEASVSWKRLLTDTIESMDMPALDPRGKAILAHSIETLKPIAEEIQLSNGEGFRRGQRRVMFRLKTDLAGPQVLFAQAELGLGNDKFWTESAWSLRRVVFGLLLGVPRSGLQEMAALRRSRVELVRLDGEPE
jgi:hypothetical protein